MPVRPVLQYPEDEAALRQKSEPVGEIDEAVRALITDLYDTLATEPGAGLAAPQIGVHKRVALVAFGQDEGEIQPPITLINPVILETSNDDKGFDGCLSLPNVLTWDTVRPHWIRFEALNDDGERFEMTVEGIDAIVVHHEIDHLDGVFFLDRLPEDGQLFWYHEDPDEPKPRMIPIPDITNLPPEIPPLPDEDDAVEADDIGE